MKARIQKFIILAGICLPSISLQAVVGVSILYSLIRIPSPNLRYPRISFSSFSPSSFCLARFFIRECIQY